ncbi:quinol monooxygenase YgiN [Fontibacillus phaseoli]|uniref:Quinol monooxygenase YgiN n=1 Tax=Fontibacillus phaseoli TaxID=1416533 RepID=A0A369B441_9BACL|nr:putative quinol monooxygenase [Fontibacillus phaseoli]RCX16221.1 quinol monooxygenase YgiN [Fontibacillus phaseoli]
MIIIHAHMQIKPQQEEAFLEEVRSLVASSRAEEGNISYDLLKSTQQENRYTMVELWKNTEAVGMHNASEHFTAFTQKAKEFLAAPMEAKLYSGEPLQL